MQNKKIALIVAAVLVVVIGGGVLAFTKMRGQPAETSEQQQQKKKVAEPVNVLPLAERPYLQILPKDVHNLTLRVVALKKAASNVEYELEYQAGTLLQGAFGAIETTTLPAEKTVLLGSCSAGGACTYHEDVKGGTLLTRYSGENSYALKSDWRYFDNQAKESIVASRDAKFQLESAALKNNRFLIVFNNSGFPEGLVGTPVSEPYSLTSASPLKGSGELTIRATEEGATAVMGWTGSAWKEFAAQTDGKTVTATVELLDLYIAVKN